MLRRFTAPPPAPAGIDPAALSIVQTGLYEATHSAIGTSSGVFGAFPVTIAGKTGTAEKLVTLPGQDRALLLDQSWWCGYGPTESPTIAVCVVIENGGHGGTAAAPAALKVFQKFFDVRRLDHDLAHLRLMAFEAVDTRARGLRPHRPRGAAAIARGRARPRLDAARR